MALCCLVYTFEQLRMIGGVNVQHKAAPIMLIILPIFLSRNSFKIHLLFLKLFSIKTILLP